MYCPNCGKPDQEIETFCRQCGSFLPDFEKAAKRKTTPEDHLKANTVMSLLTGLVSLTLAVILYSMFLGKEGTPVIIYVVAGFLTAMFGWQTQVFIRTLMLKKQLKKPQNVESEPELFESKPTGELLPEADLENVVPASVVENTTRDLKEHAKRSAKS
ncbi:MAG: hypothetical protein R2681_17130 [Pyrinomonadaceae bacterium]